MFGAAERGLQVPREQSADNPPGPKPACRQVPTVRGATADEGVGREGPVLSASLSPTDRPTLRSALSVGGWRNCRLWVADRLPTGRQVVMAGSPLARRRRRCGRPRAPAPL